MPAAVTKPSAEDAARPAYETPSLRVLGTVHELTRTLCIFNKTLGSPDYWAHIPIANCSS